MIAFPYAYRHTNRLFRADGVCIIFCAGVVCPKGVCMLLSIALIFVLAFPLGYLLKKLRLPALIGYMLIGVVLNALSLIDSSLIAISSDIRKAALVLILLRSGLSLSVKDLKKIGRPAFLMCFLPATFEILAVGLIAPAVFGISRTQAFMLGSMLGAVSPAVVAPRMIDMIERGQGINSGVPQLILAGASADDVYAVVAFTSFCSLAVGESVSVISFINIPVSVLSGAAIGAGIGLLFAFLFKKFEIRGAVKAAAVFAVCIGLAAGEDALKSVSVPVTYSGLIAAMAAGMAISARDKENGKKLSSSLNNIWIAAEVLLFALVGVAVDFSCFITYLPKALVIISAGLLLRMVGVMLCCVKTKLNFKERLFSCMAYTPKATVQAALIGSIPAALSSEASAIIISVAAAAILITAPIGALSIDLTRDRLVPVTN